MYTVCTTLLITKLCGIRLGSWYYIKMPLLLESYGSFKGKHAYWNFHFLGLLLFSSYVEAALSLLLFKTFLPWFKEVSMNYETSIWCFAVAVHKYFSWNVSVCNAWKWKNFLFDFNGVREVFRFSVLHILKNIFKNWLFWGFRQSKPKSLVWLFRPLLSPFWDPLSSFESPRVP